jgi:hypothetical protein
VSFDYQSPNSQEASYYIAFDDPDNTVVSASLPIADSKWHSFSRQIQAPYGARHMLLTVFAKAATNGTTWTINRYDNFSVMQIPDLTQDFYLVTPATQPLNKPSNIAYQLIDPTRTAIRIKGATTPFFLSMSESYHPDWRLEINNSKIQGMLSSWVPWVKPDMVPINNHFDLNGFENGWYIDIDQLCKQQKLCIRNSDGSYDLQMVSEFAPERWVNVGVLLGTCTLLGCFVFLGWSRLRFQRRKN